MTLPDGPRQIAAALLAAVVFLALFFAVNLVWFLALPLAVAAYAALLLIIRRRPLLSETVLSDRVTAADIAAGQAALDEALRRLAKADAASDTDLQSDLAADRHDPFIALIDTADADAAAELAVAH